MSRRLLLINPAHMVDGRQHTGPARFPIPPVNLGYVAALTPDHWEVRIIDEEQRIEDGLEWEPDLVGLTALTPSAPRAYQLAREYRQAGIPVVMGGVHASSGSAELQRPMEIRPSWLKLDTKLRAIASRGCLKYDRTPSACFARRAWLAGQSLLRSPRKRAA